MSHSQRETLLVRKIRKAIHEEHPRAWVLKVAGGPYQPAGVPDLLVVVHGLLVALEVKAQQPGESAEHARGRTTLLQRETILRLRQAGAIAEVVVSVEEALAVVARATGPDEGQGLDSTDRPGLGLPT